MRFLLHKPTTISCSPMRMWPEAFENTSLAVARPSGRSSPRPGAPAGSASHYGSAIRVSTEDFHEDQHSWGIVYACLVINNNYAGSKHSSEHSLQHSSCGVTAENGCRILQVMHAAPSMRIGCSAHPSCWHGLVPAAFIFR